MNEIIGRLKEKRILDQCLNETESQFIAIYGRRRVGKTYLIREFFRENIVFQFTGMYQADLNTQLANFLFELRKTDTDSNHYTIQNNWIEAFQQLVLFLEKLEPEKKKVIFLDEVPWMSSPRSQFLTALEYLWNSYLSLHSNYILVVCGSSASWIRQKILQNKGGLYNRVTKRIQLEQFNLAETKEYLEYRGIQLTNYQITIIYMCMGGIPYYLKEISKGRSAVQEIDRICFQKNGLLSNEFDLIYKSLFGENSRHQEIIKVLAEKPNGLTRNEILSQTTFTSGGSINRAITDLESGGFIRTVLPFGKKKIGAIFRISDFYSHFYIKFINKQKDFLPETFIQLANTPAWKAWSGYAYENICHLHLAQIKKVLGISGILSRSYAWKFLGDDNYPGCQIDLVIDRDDHVINLCEVKFSEHEFSIKSDYAKTLRIRRNIFKYATKTKNTCFTTMITTYGCIHNSYYLDEITNEITIDDLFQ